jgi:hypothetical protein
MDNTPKPVAVLFILPIYDGNIGIFDGLFPLLLFFGVCVCVLVVLECVSVQGFGSFPLLALYLFPLVPYPIDN